MGVCFKVTCINGKRPFHAFTVLNLDGMVSMLSCSLASAIFESDPFNSKVLSSEGNPIKVRSPPSVIPVPLPTTPLSSYFPRIFSWIIKTIYPVTWQPHQRTQMFSSMITLVRHLFLPTVNLQLIFLSIVQSLGVNSAFLGLLATDTPLCHRWQVERADQ